MCGFVHKLSDQKNENAITFSEIIREKMGTYCLSTDKPCSNERKPSK